MGTKPHEWLEVNCPLGDARLRITATLRTDGLTLVKIGGEDHFDAYDTLCDAEQLSELIELLTIIRDAAVEQDADGQSSQRS